MNKLNYEGKKITCGLDIHKRSWEMKIMTEHTSKRPIHIAYPNAEKVKNILSKQYPGGEYVCAYEAGFSGFWLQKELESMGIKTLVVHPADIPTTDKEKRFKDDQSDSEKIARCLRAGQLRGIYIPPIEQQRDRSLVRQRYQLASDIRRIKHRIHSHLDFYGPKPGKDSDDKYWSNRLIQELTRQAEDENDEVLAHYIEHLQLLRQMLLKVTGRLKTMAQSERFQQDYELLISIPGVGLLTALVWLTEVGLDADRFKHEDQLMSYIGLVPGSRSSGEKEQRTRMVKRGNKRLRTALVQSAWMSVRNSSEMTLYYENYRTRMSAQNAIIRVAKKLALLMRAVLKNQKRYKSKLE